MVIFYYEQGLRTAWAQIKKGMAVYIPAGMAHQVWNEDEEPAECILIMFGKGA
jgi:mannose-6-phosphate isomerase-like protein (cupin superfamily)